MIVDSNLIIYSIQPQYGPLRQFLVDNLPAYSAISYLEVLGFHKLVAHEKTLFEQMLDHDLPCIEIDPSIVKRAVTLRQQRKMSVGDAIIAATALIHDRTLLTRNVNDFRWIAGLKLLNPLAPPATGP